MLTPSTDVEANGRRLHRQLLAEARRITSAWVEVPHPAETVEPAPAAPECPPTRPMPAITASRKPEGRHRVTRLRPLGLSACILTGASLVVSQMSDLADVLPT